MMGHNIAPQLNAWHHEITVMHGNAKEAAANIGEKLIEIKAGKKHGEFLPWIEENCDFTHKRATEYMKVADLKNNSRVIFDEATSIRDALSKAKPKPKKTKPLQKRKATDRQKMIGAFIDVEPRTFAEISGYLEEQGDLSRDLNPKEKMEQVERSIRSDLRDGKIHVVNGYVSNELSRLEYTPDDLNKTNKAKYEALVRRLEKSNEIDVDRKARAIHMKWAKGTVKELEADIVKLNKRLDRIVDRPSKLDPSEFKALKMAIQGDNVSSDRRKKAWLAFEKLGLEPLSKAEIAEAADFERRKEEMKKMAGL